MSVLKKIREIENEIDLKIKNLDLWKNTKSILLQQIIEYYRDVLEVIVINELPLRTIGKPLEKLTEEKLTELCIFEDRSRAGVLWMLKWTNEFSSENGNYKRCSDKELIDLQILGTAYESFVDGLKCFNHDLNTISIDEVNKIITFYEGNQKGEFDSNIVEKQYLLNSLSRQTSLTEDEDKLTLNWTAGDYRKFLNGLSENAIKNENKIFVDKKFLKTIGKTNLSNPQPTIIWLERPDKAPYQKLFDDLTLPSIINEKNKWKLVSFLDTPIIEVDGKYCALSGDLKALALCDDHMLRLAAYIDPEQYSKVSTLREQRMIDLCRKEFKSCGNPWEFDSNIILRDPKQEADILVADTKLTLTIQLKSTIRPGTPWESYKRNQDIICGIEHTRTLIERNFAQLGMVLTDGYLGDYECWAKSLELDIPILTLSDLPQLAIDPNNAAKIAKRRIGIGEKTQKPTRIEFQEADLLDWQLRFIDSETPRENN
ncbi:MAG: hypothetical protein ACUZ8E_03660 [Candidatus Anammoxibacter sp.]